jgi:hypothetical protein
LLRRRRLKYDPLRKSSVDRRRMRWRLKRKSSRDRSRDWCGVWVWWRDVRLFSPLASALFLFISRGRWIFCDEDLTRFAGLLLFVY